MIWLYEMARIGNYRESRRVVARDGGEEEWEVTAKGCGGNDNILN